MPPGFGYDNNFAESALKIGEESLAGEERGQQQATADQFARFGSALAPAQEAISRGTRQRFAGLRGQLGANINLEGGRQDLVGRRQAQEMQFQEDQFKADEDLADYMQSESLKQRKSELSLLREAEERRRAGALNAAIIRFAATMAGGITGGSGGAQLGSELGGAAGDMF